ncbi:phosphotransferase [Candidatus Bathyarchaeota archaeon]|nr:phosphotransferase [Candidatus Bathyarchaeota archaeon]
MAPNLEQQLTDYLQTLYSDQADLAITEMGEINMGWETELHTLKVRSTRQGETVDKDMVLRVFSGGSAQRKSRKEYMVMRRLREEGYPVPEVYDHDTGKAIGKSFILMERVIGDTLDQRYMEDAAAPEEGVRLLMQLFVELHRLDASPFRDIPGMGGADDSVDSSLRWYRELAEDEAKWILPVVEWLEGRSPGVDPAAPSVLHMDYHGMNVMLWGDGTPTVIDWSAAKIGDYREDLAWSLLLYTTFGGDAYRPMILNQYQRISGRETKDIRFFEVLAALRRVTDLALTVKGSGGAGLKPGAAELMRTHIEHYRRVHDFLEARTGLRLAEFDSLIESM